MAAGEHAMPAAVRERLWREAEDGHAYTVLDGAQIDNLLEHLYAPGGPAFECLFASELEPDMACVAPYLVRLEQGSAFTGWLLDNGWGLNWGIYLASSEPLPKVWRHFRQRTMVYMPSGEPMYFRFYDPRVLRVFLPSCDGAALAEFFGPARTLLAEQLEPQAAHAWSLADERLVQAAVN